MKCNILDAKNKFWSHIKNKQINGLIFRKEVNIEHYIVDFYCPKLKLIIEVNDHFYATIDSIKYNMFRDLYLESIGFNVFRFSDINVNNKIDEVIDELRQICS